MPSYVDVSVLQQASRGPVLGELAKFGGKLPRDWLEATHPARNGQLPLKWADVELIGDMDRISAVAVLGPTHCIDGWGYLSRSIAALVSGDPHASRHLAYYAQLRAALSMLASVGVGVFNRINFVVRDDGTTARLDPGSGKRGVGTHDIAWDALEAWASEQATAVAFLDLVRLRGVSLGECISSVWPGFSQQAISGQMISAWGLDLRRGKADHIFRNISSYSPTSLNFIPVSIAQTGEVLKVIWTLFRPSSLMGFDNIDKFLLRSALQSVHSVVHGNGLNFSGGAIANKYDELPSIIQALASKEFLIDPLRDDDPSILAMASSANTPAHPLDMIARSILLLRTAMAFCQANLSDSGIMSSGGFKVWLEDVACSRGFYDPAEPIEDLYDLWYDVEIALDSLQASINPVPTSLKQWASRSNGLPVITETERIGLWSLAG